MTTPENRSTVAAREGVKMTTDGNRTLAELIFDQFWIEIALSQIEIALSHSLRPLCYRPIHKNLYSVSNHFGKKQ